MKSLLITTELFDIGGLETHIKGEVACLAEEGFRVHLASGLSTNGKMLPNEAASVTAGLALGPTTTISELIRTVESLRKIIREHAVDCVHAHPFTSLIPSQIAAELEGVPFVITLHGPASLSDRYGPLFDFLLTSIILPNADMVVAVSQEVADLASPYVSDAQLYMLPNGVPMGEFSECHYKANHDGRWLIVSRLDLQKIAGIRDFIQKSALAGLPGVLIAGDGDARGKLSSQLDNDGLLGYAEFVGSSTEVSKLMQQAAGVAGMGRVVIEGLACAKPVMLVGYDGVKGKITTHDEFWTAASANFSGRNMPNIDATEFAHQLSSLKNRSEDLTALVSTEYSDKFIWRKFAKQVRSLRPHGKSILADTYCRFASDISTNPEAYLHSRAWHEQVGRLVHSAKHFDDKVVANFSYFEKRNIEIKLLADRDAAIAARDHLQSTLNETQANLQRMLDSRSWRITRPIRIAARWTRNGINHDDWKKLERALKTRFARFPLPTPVRNQLRTLYHAVWRTFRRWQPSAPRFPRPNADKLAAKNLECPDYIFWGVIDWHFRHQRPQHLAQEIAANGRRVFYVSAHLEDNAGPGFSVEPLDDAGRLFQIRLYVRGAPSIYQQAPDAVVVAQLRASVGELLDWADCRRIVSVVQHSFWHGVASVLSNSRLVYDCMDHHEGFGNNGTGILALEQQLLRDADLTIATSAWLAELLTPRTAHCHIVRNAGDYEHFAQVPDTVFRDKSGRKVIGYIGAIAEWFDFELVEKIAMRFADYLVLLVGNDSAGIGTRLRHLPNVQLTGEIPYKELPFYVHGFDVCLLPFRIIPLTLATNPVKVYEYLGTGKPVVATALPETLQFGDLIETAASHDAYLDAVGRALAADPAAGREARQAFAREQTWRHRARDVIALSEAPADEPLVSVIVLTYNNLALTQACLASLEMYSDYPAMEIIVVDNASTDGSPDFLRAWAEGGGNRKLVLNPDNRGFAAGNNQGLEIAQGEYLILLNNDTHVTPGWVRTLVGHLRRDASIGLIGPVTNNIGNEAKIEIDYDHMSQMLERSAAFTRRHLGATFEISTAAFFCVAMSRMVYSRIGPLDEKFGRGFFEDDDYCRRVEQIGMRIVCAEDVFVHHHLSASFNKLRNAERQQLFDENKAYYESKWGAWQPHSHR